MTSVTSYKVPAVLLDELGIVEPQDIKIEAIAEYCGATIVYESLKGCEARILGHGDRAIITVNGTSLRERQRFSGAHELGHWMRDRGKIAFACTEMVFTAEWAVENPEWRANRYAAELLLPESMFFPRAKNKEITFATVRNLANDFVASLTATAIRLIELGSFPAIVVCYEEGKRRWFTRAPDVPQSLWPRMEPASYTSAYDLIRGVTTAEGPADVCADGWFEIRNSDRYEVREDSIKISNRFVLTLLWWKDERQILDLT
jgi:Zn-dependent peptidase ImmA (M78 family)